MWRSGFLLQEDVEKRFPPTSHQMFIALGYSKVNALRAEKFRQAQAKGYHLVSYVSSKPNFFHFIRGNAFLDNSAA